MHMQCDGGGGLANGTGAERPGRRPVDRLQGCERTLLTTLCARAADARRPLSLLEDHLSLEVLGLLAPELALDRPRLAVIVRTLELDEVVRSFLRGHPDGTVVELGAGLSTRFDRLDNGRQRWIDVDLPAVTALRRALLPTSPRRVHVAASLAESTWLDQVVGGPACCFVAEAVLGYLPGPVVRELLAHLARRCPGATIAFDLHPRWSAVNGELVKRPPGPLAVDLPRLIERWGDGLELVAATELLASAPRRRGPLRMSAIGPGATAACVVARYRARGVGANPSA